MKYKGGKDLTPTAAFGSPGLSPCLVMQVTRDFSLVIPTSRGGMPIHSLVLFAKARRRMDRQVEKLAQSESYKEVAGLLRCFHGIGSLLVV